MNNTAVTSSTDVPIPSADPTGGYGGAISVRGGTAQVSSALFDGNKADKSGGAVTIGPNGKMNLSNNSAFLNNSCILGQGGAIHVRPYSYQNPSDPTAYRNLITDDSIVFQNNSAPSTYEPPTNYASFGTLLFSRTSFTDKKNPCTGENILANDSLLNNYDINYKSQEDTPMQTISYAFLSTGSEALPREVLNLLPASRSAELGSIAIPELIKNTKLKLSGGTWEFICWDKTQVLVGTNGVKFIGTWGFTPEKAKASQQNVVSAPQTDDISETYLWTSLAILSIASLLIVCSGKRTLKQKSR